ncbi:MAG TPA: ATP-binding protein [Candidatus Saccharimonadales bacterium]|nr:ATP-binding protein [Candidatus Saccharimonadales bacterium]
MTDPAIKKVLRERRRSKTERERYDLLWRFSPVGVVVFGIFGVIHVWGGEAFKGWFELGLGGLVSLNALWLRLTRQVETAAVGMTLILGVSLTFLILVGGLENTGTYWVFVFPVVAYFLHGRRVGTVWMSLFLLDIVAVGLLEAVGIVGTPYSLANLRQMLISLIVVSVLVYLDQRLIDTNKFELEDRSRELERANKQLSGMIHSLEEANILITHAKNEADKLNRLTVDRELKMIEFKRQLGKPIGNQAPVAEFRTGETPASPEDTQKAMLNMLEDLSEEKVHAEASRLRDEALLTSIGEGLIVIDEKGNISRINPAGLATLGYKPEEVEGKWFPGLIKAADEEGAKIDPLDRPITKALTTGQVVTEAVLYRRKNGTSFPAAITVSPVVLKGKPIGAIEVFRDITKERQLEEAKEEFVSLASHQLRTPATGVKAFVSMLIDGYAGKLTAKQLSFVKKVYDTNERQLQIVNDMLNVARIDAGRITPDFLPTDVKGLVKDTVDEQTLTIKERKQKIELDLPAGDVKATLDPKLIRMVVDNLVSNASKYTPDGGKITVVLSQSKQKLQVVVSDSGVGIAKVDISKLFKRFSRIDNRLSTQRGGTGLGLYLTRNIVLLHHGKLMVDSTVGKGTIFTLELPLEPPKKPNAQSVLEPPASKP